MTVPADWLPTRMDCILPAKQTGTSTSYLKPNAERAVGFSYDRPYSQSEARRVPVFFYDGSVKRLESVNMYQYANGVVDTSNTMGSLSLPESWDMNEGGPLAVDVSDFPHGLFLLIPPPGAATLMLAYVRGEGVADPAPVGYFQSSGGSRIYGYCHGMSDEGLIIEGSSYEVLNLKAGSNPLSWGNLLNTDSYGTFVYPRQIYTSTGPTNSSVSIIALNYSSLKKDGVSINKTSTDYTPTLKKALVVDDDAPDSSRVQVILPSWVPLDSSFNIVYDE